MKKQTFTLTITGEEHGEWQGKLGVPDGRTADFRSILELIRAVQQELQRQTKQA